MKKKETKEVTVVRSLRISEELYNKVNKEAEKLGLNFNTFVANAIRKALNEEDKSAKLLDAIAKWLKDNYSWENFPEDVILKAFHHIRADKKLRKLYDQIVLDSAGRKNYDVLVPLHKNIGLLVKTLLNAKVKGRSIEHDPEIHLLKTFALLEK